jgi:exosortase
MRQALFLLVSAIGVVLYRDSVTELAFLFFRSELHQHIPLIPLISGYFLLVNRSRIRLHQGWNPWTGLVTVAAGGLVWGAAEFFSPGVARGDHLSAKMAGLVLWVLGAFVLAYGLKSLREGLFPMLFLAFIIPVPGFILDPSVSFLQTTSATAADFIFRLTGVPFLREGMFFSLPGIEVEVAKQCSGIRSSLSLIITALIAGKLFLQKGTGKIALVSAVIPITIFKNALRIVTLSILASYVDPVFITGHWLHRSGGIPFFVVGLALLSPVLWLLRRLEGKPTSRAAGPGLSVFPHRRA